MTPLEVEREGSLIRLRGDLDAQTAPLLDGAAAEVAAAGTEEIVLDLSEVDFVDSSGLRSILAARRTAGADGLVLRSPSRAVAAILELTGLAGQFTVEP